MAPDLIYLDHNATTPIDPRVVEAMARAWRDCGANPASQHAPGRRARRMLEEAREGILELLGAKTGGMDADQLIFTSGGTEANNLFLAGSKPAPGNSLTIVASPLEHPSILAAAEMLQRQGCQVVRLKAGRDGRVPATLPHFGPPALISLMLASNETGVIQPLADIAPMGRDQGTLLHTDAVQAVGKIPVNFRALDVDAMTVAPHKFHGPLGIGALVLKHDMKLQPQLFGGYQQGGLRPGTENVALAVGFYEALKIAVSELPQRTERMAALRDQLESALLIQDRPEAYPTVVIGKDSPRLPNTTCVSFPGLDRQALVMALDMAGVACSTGSACASGSSEPSPTLIAMGLPADVIRGAIRVSLGAFTTAVEVAEAARRILNAVKHLRSHESG